MIHVLHSLIVPGRELAYESAHRAVPDELIPALARAGITNWSIHRVGDHLIHAVESDNLVAAFKSLSNEPANDRWQTDIGRYVDRFDPSDETGTPLAIPALWELATQRGTTTAQVQPS